MAEQSGPSAAAVRARRLALAARDRAVADADDALAETLVGAHAATVEARGRIAAIAAEIEGCVRNQAAFAVDTPLGARELQRVLIAKHRELIAAVADARRDDLARQATLQSLLPRYSAGELSR